MVIVSKSEQETLKIGRLIARNLQAGDIVCLFGELGSGKTVLTKGIAQGLGLRKNQIISPSFVLIREHPEARLPLYHFDLFRLKRPEDVLALGYEEYLYGEGVAVIEWADRLKYLSPPGFLKIKLLVRGNAKRQLEFSAFGKRHLELLRFIKKLS